MSATSILYLSFILVQLSLYSRTGSSYRGSQSLVQRLKRQSSCTQLQWKCVNLECIPSYNVCDGTQDCSDGSDETHSACRAINIRCPSLAFECAYGACIDKELKCNGRSDCADGSDEQGCSGSPEPTISSRCESGKFQCTDGQCIDQYVICDGVKDCNDGSDETSSLCKSLKCPSNNFQCKYGACLEKSLRCNGQLDCPDGSDEDGCDDSTSTIYRPVTPSSTFRGCKLPDHPKYGVYISSLCQPGDPRDACRNLPGTPVNNNWLLKYSCNANYDLTSSDSEYSVCENGVWKNPLDCIKLCKPLKKLSVEVKCVFGGQEVSCDKPMKPNTTATAKCKQHYRLLYQPEYSSLLCHDNGDWSYRLFDCTPDCGISTKSETLTTLILNGLPTHQGEYPWLAALYLRNSSNMWEQKCGGTLITPHIVLTAAHCLVLTDGTVTQEDIKVGLGKYYRDFYKLENYSSIVDVREVITPRDYSGLATLYALDIGLLDLVKSVQVTAYIMPACFDWSGILTINPNDVGQVAGWGTTENRTSSETVLSAQLSYIDNKSCIKKVRSIYQRLITHDKFCAGSLNGSQVDKGDSGGGLTFIKDVEQHFVFGVVSTKITEERTFSLFTDLSNAQHYAWLNEQKTRLDRLHNER